MPGQPPLLQGHLKARAVRAIDASEVAAPKPPTDGGSATGPDQAGAAKGRATKTIEATATRDHLEGSEQGPS
jgi:hypothetical protein